MKTLTWKNYARGSLSITFLTLALISSSVAVGDVWTTKADMPTARMLLGTCVVDGKIYAIGGASAPYVAVSAVQEYDPETDTWTRKAPMPTPRAGLGVSAVNGKIYAIGGSPSGARAVEEYDPAADTWTRKADMPTARAFFTTSVVNGKIYAIGGATDTHGPAFEVVEEYDPVTDIWTRKANLPEARYLHAAGVVDGKIYIIAGSWQEYTASRAVFAYDPATDIWERKADAPTARSWLPPTAGVADGRIYVIGGDAGPPDAEVEEYDPATDTWTARADMPTPRGALSITALNGRIYVIGGTVTLFNDVLSTVEEYYPNPLVVDFNGDGMVDIKDLLRMIESWGQRDPIVDIAPRPFGDGIIDAADLEILMSHWGREIPSPYLIAHWKLDEAEGLIAEDSVGHNDATVIGTPTWRPAGGVVDGALELDGATFVVADFLLNPQEGPFSVFAWVNGGAPGQAIVSQQAGANWLSSDAATGALMTELRSGGRVSKALSCEAVITDGTWHRVGFTWDGSNRRLYVDDILVAEDTDVALGACNGGLNIGCGKIMAPMSLFTGLIDDVRIYNSAVRP